MATAKKTPSAAAPAAAKAPTMPVTPAAATDTPAKPAAKTSRAKPVASKTKTAASPETAAAKADKATKKPKLVRDSFTIPKLEYLVLDELKARAAKLASPAKKSEVLRAGVKALAAMSDAGFLSALKAVPAVKTGRPNKLVED